MCDIDLILYRKELIEDSYGFSKKQGDFKLQESSSVVQVYEKAMKEIKIPVAYQNPKEATRSFLKGLNEIIAFINKKIMELCYIDKYRIDTNKFEVTEFAKIRAQDENDIFYFPVEAKQVVTVNNLELEVELNFDNPTSLPQNNQENGYQGSHFGFTILMNSRCLRSRGHVLITTFVGFPSRNRNQKSEVLEEMKAAIAPKVISFKKLCKAALDSKDLPFDITTDRGISISQDQNVTMVTDKRIQLLPQDVQNLHISFKKCNFRFPSNKIRSFLK